MRAITLTTLRLLIRAEFRRSAAMSSDLPMAALSLSRICTMAASRTFYFVQSQAFRQVLGTTQVMPVPTALERTGIDTHHLSRRFHVTRSPSLLIRVSPPFCARYPLPNYAAGLLPTHTYATASKVATDAGPASVRIDHKFSSKDQFMARFNLDNLAGPTTNPDQTAIDPAFGIQFDRPPAQCRGRLYPHRFSSPCARVIHQHQPFHAGFSNAGLHGSSNQIQRWSV